MNLSSLTLLIHGKHNNNIIKTKIISEHNNNNINNNNNNIIPMYVQCNAKNNLQLILVTHKVDNKDVHLSSTVSTIITVHLFHEPLLQFFAVSGKK